MVGFLGVGLLVSPADIIGGGQVDPLGALVLVGASLAWAMGSVYVARGAPLPKSPLLTTGMQMLLGGAMLLVLGTGVGEWGRIDVAAISLKSLLALGYLLFFGAIVGFTAYTYLLQNTTPTRASTYAFVNPGVAVLLGWLLAGEPISARVILASLTIIGAVVLITSHQASARGGPPPNRPLPPKVPAHRVPTETGVIG